MKKSINLLFLTLICACYRDFTCDCNRIKGCKIVKFIKQSDSSLLEKRVLCRNVYFPYDSAYLDTIKVMKVKYDTVTVNKILYKVLVTDSIYKRDSSSNIRANDTKRYYDSAYTCKCKD